MGKGSLLVPETSHPVFLGFPHLPWTASQQECLANFSFLGPKMFKSQISNLSGKKILNTLSILSNLRRWSSSQTHKNTYTLITLYFL